MNKCEKCIGREYCASKYTFSAWCKNMDKFRIFKKTFLESRKIIESQLFEKKRGEYMGYVIIDNKKYKITEIEGDEVYYRDEYGIEHAVPIH